MEVRYMAGSAALLDLKDENIQASLVGMAVDYLTRYALGEGEGWYQAEGAFSISLLGARMVGREDYARELCEFLNEERSQGSGRQGGPTVDYMVPDLGDPVTGEVYTLKRVTVPSAAAIDAAVKLASFDSAFRAGVAFYNPDAMTTPDETTVEHITMMVARSLEFVREYGPITQAGFLAGDSDGDFLTADTIWDFKVSVKPPTSEHTLQLLALWIMGTRRGGFKSIKHLGIYNPRLDVVYRLQVASIPADVIAEVSSSEIVV